MSEFTDRLDSALAADSKNMDRWFTQILERNHKFKRAFSRSLISELSQMQITPDGKRIKPVFANANRLDEMVNDLPFYFDQAGITKLTPDLIDIINKRINTADVVWNKLDLDNLKIGDDARVIPAVLEQLGYVMDSVRRGTEAQEIELSRTLLNYRNTVFDNESVSFAQLKSDLISKSGILPKYAGTVANTSLFAIDRTIRKEQGKKSGIETAKYYGPMDKLTRSFCAEHVGLIRSWEYWEMITNDTGPQPSTVYGGGYNCRHQLVPFDKDWIKENGANQQETAPNPIDSGTSWRAVNNREEAKQQIRNILERDGQNLGTVMFDSKMDIDLINTKMNTFTKLLQEYELSTTPDYTTEKVKIDFSLKSRGNANGMVTIMGGLVRGINNGSRMNKYYTRNISGIDMSKSFYETNMERDFRQMTWNARVGLPIDDYTTTHEFFHATASDSTTSKKWGSQDHRDFWKEMSQIKRRYNKEISALIMQIQNAEESDRAKLYEKYFSTLISGYAEKSTDELGAEGFTMYRLGDGTNKWANEIGALHKKHFSKPIK